MITSRQKMSIAVTGVALSGLIAWGVGAAAHSVPAPSAASFAVATTLPGLTAPTGQPQLASIRTLHPQSGALVQATGPFDDRFALDALAFDGTSVSGSVRVTSDVSAVLDLEVVAGFYDAGGAFIGTARFSYHATDDGPTDPVTGTPVETIPFQVAVPAEFAGRAASASVGVPVLVNE